MESDDCGTPSSSSMACGCTRHPGIPGSSTSPSAATTTVAPGWPGDADTVEATRENPDAVADFGVEEVTAHYRELLDHMDTKPILIGHSFGGMIAQKLLGEDYGIARDRHRCRTDQGRSAAAALGVALDASGLQEPGQQAQGCDAHAPSSSATASAMRSARTSRTRCTRSGRSRRPASRSSRLPQPISPCTRR